MAQGKTIHDLYNGEETLSWFTDDYDCVTVVFCGNGVTIDIDKKDFSKVVEELIKSVKMLELYEQNK